MGCQKTFLQTVSIILLFVSLGLILLIVYQFLYLQTIYTTLQVYGLYSFGVLVGLVGMVFLTAIYGLVGSCKQNSVALCLYIVMLIIWTIFFAGIGVGLFYTIPIFLGGNCRQNSLFTNIDFFYGNASKNSSSICQSNCQCYFPNTSAYSTSQLVSLTVEAPNQTTTYSASTAVSDYGCIGWDTGVLSSGSLVFQFMQSRLMCSGWCSSTLIYRFGNVSNGIPQDTCYNLLSSNVRTYGNSIQIIAFALAGICLLTMIVSCSVKKQIEEQQGILVNQIELSQRQIRKR